MDGTVRIWDANTGSQLFTLRGHQGGIAAIAWSPDGSIVASGSMDSTVRLWDPRSGHELLLLHGHPKAVVGIAWSPDWKRLASAGLDGLIQVRVIAQHDLLELVRSRITRPLTTDECRQYIDSPRCPVLGLPR